MITADLLRISSAIVPDRIATIFDGQRESFWDLNERTNRLANALAQLGVKKDDKVAIIAVNCPQYVETYFAISKMGAVLVPLSFRAKVDEQNYMVNMSEANTLLIGDRYLDLVDSIRPSLTNVKNYISIEKGREGYLNYEELLAAASPDEYETEVGDDDMTILMFTAGTTGFPKGVMLNHSNFMNYLMENVLPADPDNEETNVLAIPLYHVAGIQTMMSSIYGGRTLALLRQFDTVEWLQMVQKEKVTRSVLVPTMLKMIIEHPDYSKYDLSSLQFITYGAAPMPFEVIKRAVELMPKVRFMNAFGQTETASTITVLGPDDHVIEGTQEEKEKKLRRLSSSIGKVLSGVEIKIVDDDAHDLPIGQVGEIVARGDRVMAGYWKNPEATASTLLRNGWLRTGDLGYMDDEGYIYLAGRAKDIIIRAGENISPEEVENVLYAHPAVDEAAVIGIPDPEWGEEVRAVVVLRQGQKASAEEIMEFCRQNLSSFKRPKSVVFVDELPRNPMGKVLKRVLREEYGQP